mmetsp:Transcript_123711/g.263753  ORF Transcript_123711/g.263753 Transcript_123711/m.263753 type:complete len:372 (+) Transcript_123711:835-1950(+)
MQLCQVRSEDAHDDGRSHKGEDPDKNGVEALERALRRDLVHAARELRQGPMQGHEILSIHTQAAVLGRRDPCCVCGVTVADTPPDTCNDVRDAHDKDDQLENAQNKDQLVRLDALGNRRDNLLHANEPEQPHYSDDAEGPRQLSEVSVAIRCQYNLGPIRADDEDVQRKPCLEVSLQDELDVEHHIPVLLHDASATGEAHVAGPEQPCGPVHQREEGIILWQREKVHRDHDHVINDHAEARHVPGDARPSVGVDDTIALLGASREDVVRLLRAINRLHDAIGPCRIDLVRFYLQDTLVRVDPLLGLAQACKLALARTPHLQHLEVGSLASTLAVLGAALAVGDSLVFPCTTQRHVVGAVGHLRRQIRHDLV